MTNGSPTAYLLWAILACIFFAFLFFHLWAYDRFNCLRWDSGRQPGAFKRVMTYSYLATLPLLVLFSVAMTVFKFKEGYYLAPNGQIYPRPYSYWAPHHKHWLLPMYFILSIAWSLELVTHLEELAFWLFLLHQGPGKREWFHSWEFRTWYLGSIIAVLGMPLTTLVTRREIEKVLAWIFLAGATAGTSTTVAFLYVLWQFPRFIRHVKDGGAEPDVVVRLATFYSLNRVRVMFRFLFTIPLLIIAVDALHGPHHIVSDPFALDFLLMMGGIGCFISSAITLLIFFPRSITRESGYRAKIVSPQNSAKVPTVTAPLPNYFHPEHEHDPSSPKAYGHPPTGPSTSRINVFRYPDAHPALASPTYPLYHSESLPARPRRSAESETSPGYETDAESIALESPTTPFHGMYQPDFRHHRHPSDHDHNYDHSQPTLRQDSSHTATSRPTSGGKSDDTVWEPQAASMSTAAAPTLSPSSWATRRHSDGPFVYDRHGVIVTAIPGSLSTSDEGHGRRSSDRERERPAGAPSQLHPYLVNFTSPIDLLDASVPIDEGSHTHMV